MKIRTPVLLALTAAALLGANPASAQLDPLTDPLPRVLGESAERRLDRVEQTLREMRTILFQGRDTGQPVVVQPAETQGQVSILDNRVVDLQETLLSINNQLDTLSSDIAALRREATQDAASMRALTQSDAAIIARIDALEKDIAARAEADRQRAADPQAAFSAAMQLYMDNQIRPAAQAFQTFVDNHPDDANAPEARYYLGEALYKQASYTEAAQAYLASIRGWPTTAWAPDAVVKLSLALIESNRAQDACSVLGEFATRYPNASTTLKADARSARTRARCA